MMKKRLKHKRESQIVQSSSFGVRIHLVRTKIKGFIQKVISNQSHLLVLIKNSCSKVSISQWYEVWISIQVIIITQKVSR